MRSIFVFLLGIVFFSYPAFAIDSVEILSGYFTGPLKNKTEYEAIPLLLGLHWDLNQPLHEKTGIDIKGDLDFAVEPFVSAVLGPNTNIEAGSNILFRYKLPFKGRVVPYLKAGIGALYMSQHVEEQSTQFNFLPQCGGGFSFFINKNTALNLEYRFRHLSNASLKEPNGGVEVDTYLFGIEFMF